MIGSKSSTGLPAGSSSSNLQARASVRQDFSMSMFQLMPNLSVSQPAVPQGWSVCSGR
jgi:hypothetical protein